MPQEELYTLNNVNISDFHQYRTNLSTAIGNLTSTKPLDFEKINKKSKITNPIELVQEYKKVVVSIVKYYVDTLKAEKEQAKKEKAEKEENIRQSGQNTATLKNELETANKAVDEAKTKYDELVKQIKEMGDAVDLQVKS